MVLAKTLCTELSKPYQLLVILLNSWSRCHHWEIFCVSDFLWIWRRKALEVVSWSQQNVKSNLGPSLQRLWNDLHETVGGINADSLPPPFAANKKSSCISAGFCLCTEAGKVVHNLRNRCINNMKVQFKGSAQRALLAKGMVVLHLTTEVDEPSLGPTLPAEHEEHFLHVGLMYFSPYRPTFQTMWRSTRASGCFQLEHNALALVDKRKTWQLHWWQVADFSTQVLSVSLEIVAAVHVSGGSSIWPPRRYGKAKRFASNPAAEKQALPLYDGEAADACGNSEGEPDDELEPGDADQDADTNILDLLANMLEEASDGGADEQDLQETIDEIPTTTATTTAAAATTETPHIEVPVEFGEGDPHAASSEVVVPQPPPIPPRTLSAGPRTQSLARVVLEHGEINFYMSKNCFQATCYRHGGCVLTRTCQASRTADSGAGRPVGFLVAWLKWGAECDSKAAHWDRDQWQAKLSHEVRLAGREDVNAEPSGDAMIAFERPVKPCDVEGEPSSLRGLLK
eukprot:6491504-Amphidinium_carterae.1